MRSVVGSIIGAVVGLAVALLAGLAMNPPAIGSSDLVAAQRQNERYLAEELSALRQEVAKLRNERPAEEHVIQLPEDGGRYHLSLVLEEGWQALRGRSVTVHSWFDSDPRLAGLKAQCHFHVYTPAHRWFHQNAHVAERFPAVILQRHDGYVLFKASGQNLRTASALADAIADSCPRPRPQPTPPPQPFPQPTPPVIPDTVLPDAKPDETAQPVSEPGLIYYLIPLLLGGAGGGLAAARKSTPL